MVIIDKLR